MSPIFDYYQQHEEMPDPIYGIIMLVVLIALLVGVSILNHREDKEKRGRY